MSLLSASGAPIVATNWPEIYLPNGIASGYHVSQLLYAAVLGAQGWELLTTMHYDFRLLFRRKIYISTVAYLLSRYAAFTYTIVSFIFQAVRVPHGTCQAVQYGLAVCYIVASPATSLLFFLRSMAIYNWQRFAAAFLGLCWLSTLAGALVIPFAVTGAEVADTQRCINTGAAPYSSASVATTFANDTAVWIAITARVFYTNFSLRSPSDLSRLPSKLKATSPITQELLKQGMLYYGITVIGNVITLGVLLSSNINPVIRSMLTIPNLALTSSMACRVHRQLIYGRRHVSNASDPERPLVGASKQHGKPPSFDAPRAPLVAMEPVRGRDSGVRGSSFKSIPTISPHGTPSTLACGSPQGSSKSRPFAFETSEEHLAPTGLFPAGALTGIPYSQQRIVATDVYGQLP